MKMIFPWLMLITILAGCGMSGIGNTEPFVDAKKDEQGNVTLLDTPRMWRDFMQDVDIDIAYERAAKHPPGVTTWNEHWSLVIKANRSGRENAPKYIAYIIESRRKVGLPELKQ